MDVKPEIPNARLVVLIKFRHDGNQLVACAINQACEIFDLNTTA